MFLHFTDDAFGRKEAPWMKHSRRAQGGGYDPGPPGGGAGGPAAPAPPDAFQQSLQPFNTALPGVQAGILANQGTIGNMAGKAGNAAAGQNPAFNNMANALNQQQQTQLTGALNAQNQQFANQGMGNSSAAMNQNNLLQQQYQQQMNVNSANMGLAGVNQQNQAFGAQAGLLGQQNAMGNDYLQNYLANPAMQTGYTAAQNAGNTGSSGKSGGGK